MSSFSGRRVGSAIIAAGLAFLFAATATAADAGHARAKAKIPQRTCFWTDQVASKFPGGLNYAFPDTGAVYWTSKVAIPEGATVILRGKYAHARYQSINSYKATDNSPTDALNDVSTVPDKGSKNPYIVGARRDTRDGKRRYTIRVVNQTVPESPAENTLYAGVPGQARQQLVYRVYLPDSFTKRELTGGVGLPSATLQLADGTVLRGEAACGALDVQPGPLGLTRLSESFYNSLRHPGGEPATYPSENPSSWNTFYNISYTIQCFFKGICSGPDPIKVGGQYSNIDNQYVTAYGNRGFADGPVWVLRGKLPTTPDTGRKVKRMTGGDMRYWSLCQNESLYTTAGAGCLYDEQVSTNRKGMYTIVSSLAADRPDNARKKCGIGYIPWPANGDGAGDSNDSLLILRNMLPSSKFKRAVQNTQVPGDEQQVMGKYLPTGSYTTTAAFEKQGC